ncbi:hypothetical protein BH11PLA2_BH11PLA2_34170 [soil metagenome]
MSLYDDHPLTALDTKAHTLLGEKSVIKSLASQASLQRLPRFVSEYMIAKFVKAETWKADLENISTKIRDLMPEQDQKEQIIDRLASTGQIKVIDFLDANLDLKTNKRSVSVPCIGQSNVRCPAEITKETPGIYDGMWGTATIKYSPESDAKAPCELTAFTPFQVGKIDLDEFTGFRKHFSTDEWMSVILQSAGYAAAAFPDRRTKLLLLTRMIPLVERNINMIELGPRQTGKTFLLRNLSGKVFTISGGKTTPANLFLNLSTKNVGILGTRKVVVFDEVAHADFAQADETISTLKDYMESGNYSRGSQNFNVDAGLVFGGNIDVDGNKPAAKYRHLLEPLPMKLQDSAFHDRMHAYLPGWEIPKITNASIATGVGFLTDYYGEVLVRMRDISMADKLSRVPLAGGMTRRDLRAVERTTSGYMKLLYPDGNATDDEMLEIVTLACELRQRVHNQLCVLAAGEFKARMIAPASVKEYTAPDMQK